jgi:hypothetical protein
MLGFFICQGKAYAQNSQKTDYLKPGYNINIISPKENQRFNSGDEVDIEIVVKGEPPVTRLFIALGLNAEWYSGNSLKTKLKLDDSYAGENAVLVLAQTDEEGEAGFIGSKKVKIFVEGEGSSEGILKPGTREPNDLEWAYYGVSFDSKSPELCYKISPEAVGSAMFSSPGNQIYYWRSQCLFYLAITTGDKSLCNEVKSVSTPYLDGSNISRDNCIASVGNPNAFAYGASFNAEKFIKALGYKDEAIPAKYKKDVIDYNDFYLDIRHSADFQRRFIKLPDFSQE